MRGETKYNPIRVLDNNRAQCWDCKHLENEAVAQDEEDGKFYALPVCDIGGGKIMMEVYSHHCPSYEER